MIEGFFFITAAVSFVLFLMVGGWGCIVVWQDIICPYIDKAKMKKALRENKKEQESRLKEYYENHPVYTGNKKWGQL